MKQFQLALIGIRCERYVGECPHFIVRQVSLTERVGSIVGTSGRELNNKLETTFSTVVSFILATVWLTDRLHPAH
jgi:hypothetical protein